jgi:hypothetical protein
MPDDKKIKTTFIVLSILTVLVTIWLFIIMTLQFLHPINNNTVDDTMFLKILEEENGEKFKTIVIQSRDSKSRQEQYLKINIDIWKPEIFILQPNIENMQNIQVEAMEQHFQVLQNDRQLKVVTNLDRCQTFEVKTYVLNDSFIVWNKNQNSICWFSIDGVNDTIIFGLDDIIDLLKLIGNILIWWNTGKNFITITNLRDGHTRELIRFDTKPKTVELFGDDLYILSSEKLTVYNLSRQEQQVIEVVADVILSPTLLLRLMSQTKSSMILELVGTTFVESSTNSNIDTDNIDDLYIFTQGHSVLICDGLRGTVQILGSHKHFLPLKNLQVKYVTSLANGFRIFLSSPTSVYVFTMVSGEVINSVVTRSDLMQITDINHSFILKKGKKDETYNCTVLPSNIVNLKANIN